MTFGDRGRSFGRGGGQTLSFDPCNKSSTRSKQRIEPGDKNRQPVRISIARPSNTYAPQAITPTNSNEGGIMYFILEIPTLTKLVSHKTAMSRRQKRSHGVKKKLN